MRLNTHSIIFLVIAILFLFIVFVINKTEHYRINSDFKINLNRLDVKESFRKEEWAPNGDGVKIIIFNYKKLENKDFDLKRLPIEENLPPNEIPTEFLNISEGYYKCIIDKEDNRDFKIMIINPQKREICVYYQIM